MNTVQYEMSRGRRALLAGSGALLAGAAALAATGTLPADANPDAELLAFCVEAEALYRRIHDLYPGGATPIADDDERTVALLPLDDEAQRLADQIYEMEATSLAGHRARARVVLGYHKDFDSFESELARQGIDGLILVALVRDLVGEAAL